MYYTVVDNNILTAESAETLTAYYDNVKKAPDDYEAGKYIIKDGDIVLNPNFEKEQEEAEKERIAMLSLTATDVERAIYKAKKMDFEDILEFVKANPPEGLDIKALKIELKANHFFRWNPYVDQIGNLLGYTSEELDYLFEHKELPKEITNE